MLRIIISLLFFIVISACGSESTSNTPKIDETEKVDTETDVIDDKVNFKISGSVMGLNGELSINLNDQVIIVSNESTFEFLVEDGTDFSLQLSDYPDNQICKTPKIDYIATSDIEGIEIHCVNRVLIDSVLSNVTDENFLACISQRNFTYIDQVIRLICSNMEIESVSGVENFDNLVFLVLSDNNISEIDVSQNLKLSYLVLENNNLTSIDVSHNDALKNLIVSGNKIDNIDVSHNEALRILLAKGANLINLDLINNTELFYLDVADNKLEAIDLSRNIKLKKAYLSGNSLVNLDTTNNIDLTFLYAFDNNITAVNLENNSQLVRLILNDNQLSTVNLTGNPSLRLIEIERNQLGDVPVGLSDLTAYDAAISLVGNLFGINANAQLLELQKTYINLTH